MEDKTTFFEDYKNLMLSFESLKKSEANPFFKSKYVPLDQILPIAKKHCAENNFIFYQTLGHNHETKKNLLATTIEHKGGRKIEGIIEIVSKDVSDPQKVGAGLTYMRRYSLTCMFGLEEVDDDGNKASNNGKAEEVYDAVGNTPTEQDLF